MQAFRRPRTASPERRRCWTCAVAAAAMMALGGCAPNEADRASESKPPVVLISVDTLRSDRLPAYGYSAIETPAIDALRADSVLFRRAYSHVPLTLPSHSSIFTGLLPPEHKVRDNIGYHLDESLTPFLPELLSDAGYRTGGAVSAYVLRATTGLSRGFEFYDDNVELVSREVLSGLQRPGRETLASALDWVRSVQQDPFFLFFHIYEPHTPYAAPEPFASRYADPYDAEVAFSDRVVVELLDSLRQLDLYDEALIVLLSDHGESLGEHGQPAHETLIYREAIQVPLILKLPGAIRAGETVERPVQLIDVLPTIAQVAGLEPPDTLQGTSLLADQRPEPTRIYAESYYARLHFGWSEQRSIIDETFQYLRGPDDEIYDLASDPAEARNLVRQERALVAQRGAEVDTLSADFESPSEADPETLAKLAALGYLGGSVETSEGEALPDPRKKSEVVAALNSGLELLSQRRYAEAARSLEVVVTSEPKLVDAWGHLGKARKNSGDLDGALKAYEEALELSSGAPQIALATALLYFERQEMAEAQAHAELAAASHPEAYDVLAQIALHQDDLVAAAKHVDDAMATRGSRVGPLVTRARLRLRQGNYAEALGLTFEAEEEFGDRQDHEVLRSLYFTRGRALAHLDRYPEAIEAFRSEIEHTPTALAPYSHLAVLYALTGQTPAIGLTLKSLIENNPTPPAHAEAVRTLRQLGDMQSASALLAAALRRWPRDSELRGLAK